jgi:hypothetical protein
MTTAVNNPDNDTPDTSELPPPVGTPEAPPAGQVPPADTPPPPTPSVEAAPERRRHGAWHVVAIIVGLLAIMPGLGMLAGGTTLAIANSTADDGYFDVTLDRLDTNGVAIATIDLWDEAGDGEDWPWVLDWLDVDVRLRVDGVDRTDDVFVGIARTDDVERYLVDAPYAELFDFEDRSPVYRRIDGAAEVAAPAEQAFWTVSTDGSGEQQLDWEVRNGRWSVVVMNADASPGVTADVEVGVHSDAVVPIAVTLIVVGGLVTIGSITLIVIGARGRRNR